jgi:hypothetical protein
LVGGGELERVLDGHCEFACGEKIYFTEFEKGKQ